MLRDDLITLLTEANLVSQMIDMPDDEDGHYGGMSVAINSREEAAQIAADAVLAHLGLTEEHGVRDEKYPEVPAFTGINERSATEMAQREGCSLVVRWVGPWRVVEETQCPSDRETQP